MHLDCDDGGVDHGMLLCEYLWRISWVPVHRGSTPEFLPQVNPDITVPYARLSLEMKQQFDSWEIITEANPFEIAEMFGNIGGFWGES